ncbi:MAG TPA: GntR family transcriptional regulator [Desulfatiglandales bacterium]|nr:GntR family transcriptional regulator [Desulfatiglandales bacterium]
MDEDRIPAYVRIGKTLKGRIESKIYAPGSLIPSEKEIEREFGFSNITIRKALDLLVNEGILVRKRGIGTRVIHRDDNRLAIKITGTFRDWFDSASGKHPKLDVEVLEIAVTTCPEPIREILSLSKDAMVWRMKRVRKFGEEPISYYINYGPPQLFEKVNENAFKKRSFFEVFKKCSGVQLSQIEQNVEAITADVDLASILRVQFGASLFFVENIYYSTSLVPIEVTHVYYRGDRYIYNAVIRLDQEERSRFPGE